MVALVDTSSPGVTIGDDWDGFGTRLTDCGSVRHEAVPMAPGLVFASAVRSSCRRQHGRSVTPAALVGVDWATPYDGVAALRDRQRNHRGGSAERAAEHP